MKTLLILSTVLFSLTAFSSDVGEEKKSDCTTANQTNKREAKASVVVEESKVADGSEKSATSTISK